MVTGGPSGPYQIATTGGSTNVVVYSGTTYTLTVTNADGVTTTRQVTVNTVADPTISNFTASGDNVVEGTQITLRATYLGGTALINPGSIEITSQGGGVGDAPTVTPSTTTTYTLTVTNTRSVSVQRSVTVNVHALPTITNFTRSPTGTVTPGTTLTFSANYSGDSAYINGTRPITSGIPITIDNVSSTTTYELIVYKAIGSTTYTTSQQLTVDVSTPAGVSMRILNAQDIEATRISYMSTFRLIYTVPNNTVGQLRFYYNNEENDRDESHFFNLSTGSGHGVRSSSVNGSMRTETVTMVLKHFNHSHDFDSWYDNSDYYNLRIDYKNDIINSSPYVVHGSITRQSSQYITNRGSRAGFFCNRLSS